MKAVLSNRIYFECLIGSELDERLSNILTYEIDQQPVSEFPRIVRNVFRVTDNIVSIPSGREDLIPEGAGIKDKRVIVDADIPDPGFTLRGNQQEALDSFEGQSGIINCKPGWGKSICALALAHKFQQKTLIVCTTTTIRDMWIKEIREHFGFEPGIVGGGKCNIDAPIVVGNIQTVRKKAQEFSAQFGILILDEVHHCPATTFTDFLNASKASMKIGLTGTMERKDGMHCVFSDYFTDYKFVGNVENTIPPVIHLYDVGVPMSANQFIPWANKVTELKKNPIYRKTILALAKTYAALGHKVLVVSDRTEFLEYIHLELENSLIITGAVKGEERDKVMQAVSTGSCDILCGTQAIFSEGVNIPILSCIILATPMNNAPLTEQLAGRVMRKMEGKLHPVVVDIRIEGNTAVRHRYTRKGVYIRNGWPMQDYHIGKLLKELNGRDSFTDLL